MWLSKLWQVLARPGTSSAGPSGFETRPINRRRPRRALGPVLREPSDRTLVTPGREICAGADGCELFGVGEDSPAHRRFGKIGGAAVFIGQGEQPFNRVCHLVMFGNSTAPVNGYFTGRREGERSPSSATMAEGLDRVLARIEKRLKALGKSANAASLEAGKRDAIRNMQRAVEAGRLGVSTATINALTGPLQTSASWLLEGVGPEEVDEEHTVPVWGNAGAGGTVFRFHEADAPIDRIPAPDGANDRTGAIEIEGESLGRIFDGWYAIYDEVRDPPTDDLLNRLCVVQLSDGRVYIKRLKQGHGKRFTLESNYEAPIENVVVVWAAKVRNIIQR